MSVHITSPSPSIPPVSVPRHENSCHEGLKNLLIPSLSSELDPQSTGGNAPLLGKLPWPIFIEVMKKVIIAGAKRQEEAELEKRKNYWKIIEQLLRSVVRFLPMDSTCEEATDSTCKGTVTNTLEQIRLGNERVNKRFSPIFFEIVLHHNCHPDEGDIQTVEERSAECETQGECSAWVESEKGLLLWGYLWHRLMKAHCIHVVSRVLASSAPCDPPHLHEAIQFTKALLRGLDREDHLSIRTSQIEVQLGLIVDRLTTGMEGWEKEMAQRYFCLFFRMIRCFPSPLYRSEFLTMCAPLFAQFAKKFLTGEGNAEQSERWYEWMAEVLQSSICPTKANKGANKERSGISWEVESDQIDQWFVEHCGWDQVGVERVKSRLLAKRTKRTLQTLPKKGGLCIVISQAIRNVQTELQKMRAQTTAEAEAAARNLWMARLSTTQKKEADTLAFTQLLNTHCTSIFLARKEVEEAQIQLHLAEITQTKLNALTSAQCKDRHTQQKKGREDLHAKNQKVKEAKRHLKQVEKPLVDHLETHGWKSDQKEEQRALAELEYHEQWCRTCQERSKDSLQLKNRVTKIEEFVEKMKKTTPGTLAVCPGGQVYVIERPLDVSEGIDPLVWVKILEATRTCMMVTREIGWEQLVKSLFGLIFQPNSHVGKLTICQIRTQFDTMLRAMRLALNFNFDTGAHLCISNHLTDYETYPDFNEFALKEMRTQFFKEIFRSPLLKYHITLRTGVAQTLCDKGTDKDDQQLLMRWVSVLPIKLRRSLAYEFAAMRDVYDREESEQTPTSPKPLGTRFLLQVFLDDLDESALYPYIAEDCPESLEEDLIGTMEALHKGREVLSRLKNEDQIKIGQAVDERLQSILRMLYKRDDQSEGQTGEDTPVTIKRSIHSQDAVKSLITERSQVEERRGRKDSSSEEIFVSELNKWKSFLEEHFKKFPECQPLTRRVTLLSAWSNWLESRELSGQKADFPKWITDNWATLFSEEGDCFMESFCENGELFSQMNADHQTRVFQDVMKHVASHFIRCVSALSPPHHACLQQLVTNLPRKIEQFPWATRYFASNNSGDARAWAEAQATREVKKQQPNWADLSDMIRHCTSQGIMEVIYAGKEELTEAGKISKVFELIMDTIDNTPAQDSLNTVSMCNVIWLCNLMDTWKKGEGLSPKAQKCITTFANYKEQLLPLESFQKWLCVSFPECTPMSKLLMFPPSSTLAEREEWNIFVGLCQFIEGGYHHITMESLHRGKDRFHFLPEAHRKEILNQLHKVRELKGVEVFLDRQHLSLPCVSWWEEHSQEGYSLEGWHALFAQEGQGCLKDVSVAGAD